MARPLLTLEEAAERLCVKPKTVLDWLHEGKLKGVKLGEVWKISEEELDRLFSSEADTKQATHQRIHKMIDELIERYGIETVKQAVEELSLVLLYCGEP